MLVAWVIALALAATFVAVRLRYPSIFEYEAAESTVASAAFVEHGIPPRAYHRIRYTAIYGGPMPAYLKTIPYLFTLDPGGEVVFLNLLNAGAAILFFFLVRRLYGLFPALLTFVLLVFSEPSIERCTAVHVRCYSVPLVLIAMVLAARVLVLREHWLMPLFAVAVAFAVQVYGFATMFLPPGLLLLFLLFRPDVPRETWRRSAMIFAVLQIPWILDDVVRGIDGPLSILRNGLFIFPAKDAQDIEGARAGALGFISSITRVVVFGKDAMLWLGVIGLAAMIVSGVWLLVRRRSPRGNHDVFFVLWLAMFLVVPAYLGAGSRVYLAQFLGPLIIARGIAVPLDWLRARGWSSAERAAAGLTAAAVAIGIVVIAGYLSAPRPTTILSDPNYPQSLQEVRAVVRRLHDRGLGRIGFNHRVHGTMLQKDTFADSYLFWTMCRHDPRVPCSVDADGLSPQTHFAALGRDFPYRSAEGTVLRFGTMQLVEYESRLRVPFRAIAFPDAETGTSGPRRHDAWVAGPPHAVQPPPPGTTASDEADRFALLDTWPSDRPGVPAYPLRRASQVAAVMMQHRLDDAFAAEARYPAPDASPLELVLRGTLQVDRLPDPGQKLHLFLSASYDDGRCQGEVLLDGVRLPQERYDDPRGEWGQFLLKVDADTTGYVQAGRPHSVTVRLRDCSAEVYDFYDLLVWAK